MLSYDFEHTEDESRLVFSGNLETKHSRELKRVLSDCTSGICSLKLNLIGVAHISYPCMEIINEFVDRWEQSGNRLIYVGKREQQFLPADSRVRREVLNKGF